MIILCILTWLLFGTLGSCVMYKNMKFEQKSICRYEIIMLIVMSVFGPPWLIISAILYFFNKYDDWLHEHIWEKDC